MNNQIKESDIQVDETSNVLAYNFNMKNKYTKEEIKKILEERAALLAENIEDSAENNFINIVEFSLNDEIYAFDVKYILQVGNIDRLTVLPGTPLFVIGITEVQEKIISVIDLRNFFDMHSADIEILSGKLIVLEYNDITFAVLADRIIGMKKVVLQSIQKDIATFDDIRKKYFFGLTNEQTIILDGGIILSDPNIIVK